MKAALAKTQTRFETILFATDFSPAAAHAVPYVKAIAKHYDSKIFAMHVRPPVVNPMTRPETWPVDIEAAKILDQQHREWLRQAFSGMKAEVLIEEGDVHSLLETEIRKNHIDLLVIGTRGRTGIGKFVLGSVAEEIFRTVHCPVLTVGPNAESPRDGFAEILCATDFSAESTTASTYAIALAQEFGASLSMLHVVPEGEPGQLVQWSELRNGAEAIMRKLAPEDVGGKAHYFVERGDPAERILELANLRQSSLIVLGARQENGFPGASTHLPIAIAHKVVAKANCPVLTIH